MALDNKEVLISEVLWLVVPPKISKEELELHIIDLVGLAPTQEEAWDKFIQPALNRKAYEDDGYKSVEVVVSVQLKEKE